MKPRWSYALKVSSGGGPYWMFRNDGKKFGPFQHLEHARRTAARFTSWAVQPWSK